jgi:type I restriction enzyme S subunit
MRDDWTETTLGDIASFEYGKPLKAENRDGVGFPVFGSAGEVGRHSEPLIRDAPVIVVGRKGTAGAVWWSDLPCSVIDTAYFVVPKISLDFKYLFQLLGFLDLPSLTAQTGVPGLNRERAYSSEVALPPIAEQKRIVDVVSSVDAYINALQQQVDAARTARNAVLSKLILDSSSISVSLGDVVKIVAPLVDPTDSRYSKMPHIGVERIQSSTGRILEFKTALEDGVTSGKYLFQADDVLFSKIRPELRKASFPGWVGLSSAEVYPLSCSPRVIPRYLLFILLSNEFSLEVIAKSGRTKMPKVNRSELLSIDIFLPSIAEQQRIVEIVSSMDDVIQSAERAIVEAKNLRSGLLSDLLSGEHEIPVSYDAFLEAA